MSDNLDRFNSLWESFLTTLKGALYTAAREKKLDYNHAQATLAELSMCWQNDYASEGRWINQLVQEDGAKGKLVRKILVQDMKFTQQANLSRSYAPLALGVIGGGALGYGVAALADMEAFGSIATTVATVAIGGIVGNNLTEKKKSAAVKAVIDSYIGQLDSYYNSVISALKA